MTDSEAIGRLERAGYAIEKGVIQAPRDVLEPKKFREPTVAEAEAITYLCQEWDYGYVG